MKKIFFLTILLVVIFFPKISSATSGACSYHGGVDCGRGRRVDGMVNCMDGWDDSITSYDFTTKCQNQTQNNCSGYSANCKYLNNSTLLDEKKATVSSKIQKELDNASYLKSVATEDGVYNIFRQQEIILTIRKGYLIGNYMDYLCNCIKVDEIIDLYTTTNMDGIPDSVIKEALGLIGDGKTTEDPNTTCQNHYGANSFYTGNKDKAGNYNCDCKSGYNWDVFKTFCGLSTKDKDDECKKIYGSYSFYTYKKECGCPDGYQLDIDKKQCVQKISCTAPNVLEEGNCLTPNGICTKHYGVNSFFTGNYNETKGVICDCQNGYGLEGQHCVLNKNTTVKIQKTTTTFNQTSNSNPTKQTVGEDKPNTLTTNQPLQEQKIVNNPVNSLFSISNKPKEVVSNMFVKIRGWFLRLFKPTKTKS